MATTEKEQVVKRIVEQLSDTFNVNFNPKDNPTHHIAGSFPDVILANKESGDIDFVIEIKKNGDIANDAQKLKELSHLSSTLYILVPQSELKNAKLVADLNGIKARFAWYELNETNEVDIIRFE